MKELKFIQQRLRPLTSYCYLEQETYYHDHVTTLSLRTTSSLDSQQVQALSLMYLSALETATELITKLLTSVMILITLSIYEGKYLQISQEIHAHSISTTTKTWLGFFLLYLKQNIKSYTSYGLGLSWKFRRKSILHKLRSIESNFQLIEPCKN